MQIHCKKNAIHNRINDICIAGMLIHVKNNTIHRKSMIDVLPGCQLTVKITRFIVKSNDICIAWMLTHCKNAIHCKTNNISIAWMLIHC